MSEPWLDLSPKAVHAEPTDPPASERAKAVWPGTDLSGIEEITRRYARMTDEEQAAFLRKLEDDRG